MNNITHKTCKDCGVLKPTTEFHKRGVFSYGSYCKACQKSRVDRWYVENKKRANANSHKNYIANKDSVNKRAKQWRLANIEKARESVRKYLSSEKGKAMRKRNNTEERREKDRRRALAWANANEDKHRETARRWRIENPEKYRHNKLVRYGREKGAEGRYALSEWDAILNYYTPGGVCLSCGKVKKLQRDHVVPLVRGGTNYISNIQPLCANCNSRKRDKTIDYRPDKGEFARRLRDG